MKLLKGINRLFFNSRHIIYVCYSYFQYISAVHATLVTIENQQNPREVIAPDI